MNLTIADNAFTLYYVKFRASAPKVRVSIYYIFFNPLISCLHDTLKETSSPSLPVLD